MVKKKKASRYRKAFTYVNTYKKYYPSNLAECFLDFFVCFLIESICGIKVTGLFFSSK
ncbi:MAG: hypothetical protein RL151_1387 [Bacteroidota bacterium]